VAHRVAGKLDFETLARHLEPLGEVTYNRFLLRFQVEGHEFTVFPDGRAIIKGTDDVERARTLYAKYLGH
jgi:adenylyltransferase/sulfurtransferase